MTRTWAHELFWARAACKLLLLRIWKAQGSSLVPETKGPHGFPEFFPINGVIVS
jgi:hypothetical protein